MISGTLTLSVFFCILCSEPSTGRLAACLFTPVWVAHFPKWKKTCILPCAPPYGYQHPANPAEHIHQGTIYPSNPFRAAEPYATAETMTSALWSYSEQKTCICHRYDVNPSFPLVCCLIASTNGARWRILMRHTTCVTKVSCVTRYATIQG